MKVCKLIRLLSLVDQNLEVIRGDTDWGGVLVTNARVVRAQRAHTSGRSDCFWENDDGIEDLENDNRSFIKIV